MIVKGHHVAETLKTIVRRGKTWTIRKVSLAEAEAEDFRFWYEELSPAERVEAVHEALLQCLKTRGINAVPRLRRVCRRIKRRQLKS